MSIDKFLKENYISVKTCVKCNQTKSWPDMFFTGKTCKKCRKKQDRTRSRTNAQNFVSEYLKKHPCVDCGMADIRVLEFDHIGIKNAGICELIHSGYSKKRIQEEINLCQVVCANCHRIRTMSRGNHFRHKTTRLL